MPVEPKRLVWLVDSLEAMREFPPGVRTKLGFALYQAQQGGRHESAKLLRGFDEAVWQVRADDRSGTYRAAYLARIGDAVYVLHAFQKKSKAGIATPKAEMELIRQRLKLAQRLAEGRER